jgi:hypothetical protein
MKWTRESAIREAEELIKEIPQLTVQRRFSAEHTRWDIRTRNFLGEVFGRNSLYYGSFIELPWQRTGSFIVEGWNYEANADAIHQRAYREQLETAKGFLLAAVDQLRSSKFEDIYQGKNTEPESSDIVKILNLATRLRKSIHKKPTEEKEVQNAFEALLIGADVEYSREAERVEYSSKTYVPDFTFKKLDLALEIKLCHRDGQEAEIIAEINDDILAYKTKYGNIIFLVYDLGLIRDVERFASSLEEHAQVIVRVVKH